MWWWIHSLCSVPLFSFVYTRMVSRVCLDLEPAGFGEERDWLYQEAGRKRPKTKNFGLRTSGRL